MYRCNGGSVKCYFLFLFTLITFKMEAQKFVDFVVEIVTNENFLKQDDDHKTYIYGLLKESYEMNLQSRYDAGHHQGWIDGMRRSTEIIKGE